MTDRNSQAGGSVPIDSCWMMPYSNARMPSLSVSFPDHVGRALVEQRGIGFEAGCLDGGRRLHRRRLDRFDRRGGSVFVVVVVVAPLAGSSSAACARDERDEQTRGHHGDEKRSDGIRNSLAPIPVATRAGAVFEGASYGPPVPDLVPGGCC